MKASSSPSAAMAATMAFSTNAAGPSLHSFSKMDAIAKSETGVRSVLGAFLIRAVDGPILPCRKLKSQSTAVGLRSESPDLIYLRKILRSGGEEYISGQSPFAPMRQRKSQAHNSGRPPLHTCAGKRAPGAGGAQR